MILCYIAGPFTALDRFGAPDLPKIERNVRAAEDVERSILLATEQVACLVPHSLGRYFAKGPGSPAYWYDATMEMANRCDAVIMVPGWETSTGSKRERQRFIDRERPVFLTVDELVHWAENQ